jgi:hypothetical protein
MLCRRCMVVIDFPCDDCGETPKFCSICGEGLVAVCCDSCKHSLTQVIANSTHAANFCQFCGASLKGMLEKVMQEYWLNRVVEKIN